MSTECLFILYFEIVLFGISGLGTSSILAGAVLAALLKTAGKSCSMEGLLHAVSYIPLHHTNSFNLFFKFAQYRL